jgi:hypothetical protein
MGAPPPKSTESASSGEKEGRSGPASGPQPDVVEVALARALEPAATAQQWALVGMLAGELEARRRERVLMKEAER